MRHRDKFIRVVPAHSMFEHICPIFMINSVVFADVNNVIIDKCSEINYSWLVQTYRLGRVN
jgi:hypothetical protein